MNYVLLILVILLLVGVLVIQIILLKRKSPGSPVQIEAKFDGIEKGLERNEKVVRDEISKNRDETGKSFMQQREELSKVIRDLTLSVGQRLTDSALLEKTERGNFSEQLGKLTQTSEQKLEVMRLSVETKLTQIQTENASKLDQMRETVDDRLQKTLEVRLGESFKQVSDRLEQVHRGLGEMQNLALGVGDLKKVLTNIKMRGTWGEVQLGNLLEQVMTPDQYATNQITKKGSLEPVEFAIKLPGKDDDGLKEVWLPIDAKFPQEDYLRLIEAQESGDLQAARDASKGLEATVKNMARDIRDKYLDPPNTTDFGIMYLPTEGLYAEVIRRPGLIEVLLREYRVNITCPTTLAALLNCLQMGFRTLAITKRGSEVWRVLGAIKTEFGKFSVILDKVQKQLATASNSIEMAASKTRNINSKLRKVESLPIDQASEMLMLETGIESEEIDNKGDTED